jgi:peptidoglycan hydrolase-like protein with peptidoglycan-binding domain
MAVALTRDAILALQGLLAGAGLDPGPVDGLWGRRTADAVSRWLSTNQRPPVAPVAPATTSAVIYQGKARHPVDEIVVHCAATPPSWMAGRALRDQVEEIRRWHRANGWRDIGYHWIIGRDGSILPGRLESEIGAHVVERNQGTIGVCLIGGHEAAATDRFERHFTPEQATALRRHITAISNRTRIKRISGHNEYAAKGCPGFFVPGWL